MLKPLGEFIAIKPIEEEKTETGLFLPEVSEKPSIGEVVAVGEGKVLKDQVIPPKVKVGDKVLFIKYAPTEVKHEGEKYFFLREDSILAIIE